MKILLTKETSVKKIQRYIAKQDSEPEDGYDKERKDYISEQSLDDYIKSGSEPESKDDNEGKVNSEEHESERDSSDRVENEELKYYNPKYVDTLVDSPVLKCIVKVENCITPNRWKYDKLDILISNKWIEKLAYSKKEEIMNLWVLQEVIDWTLWSEPEGSLSCSQEPSTCPHPGTDQSSPYHPIPYP
jgi:hypothetical protein